MKKRLISLMLAAMMLFSVMLTGCGSSSDGDAIKDVNEDASRYTETLTMWLVTEKETTPEAAAAVEEAFNKITKAKFKTQVEMIFLTEDEYYGALEAEFARIDALIEAEEAEQKRMKEEIKRLKAEGKTLPVTTAEETSDETTAEETVLNEWGLSELKYPEKTDRQVDIVFISGYDRVVEYIEKEYLERLDDELQSSSKKLKDYINPVFMEAALIDGSTYAIPNNTVIGEYTFLMVNKDLAKELSYDVSEFKDLYSTVDFVADVAKYKPGVTPVCGDIPLTNIKYFNINRDTMEYEDGGRSIMAAYVGPTSSTGSRVNMRSLFATTQLTNQMLAIQTFKDNGYIKSDAKLSDPFGVAVVKGGYDLVETYGEAYEMIVLENPMADEETLYGGMFGVTPYTRSVARSMEIITYLNTNSELRNLLQYGIEGVNYVIDEDTGMLKRLNRTYIMDLNKTGNAFIAYPEEGMSLDAWETAKKQNLAARLNPLAGFTFAETDLKMEYVDYIEQLSETYLAKLDACQNAEEMKEFFDAAYAEVAADATMKEAVGITAEGSPNYVYNEWYNMMFPSED